MAETTLRASRPGNRTRRPKTYDAGRVCALDECGTLVSRYNRSEFCFRHRPVKYPRLRGVFSDDFASVAD
jgi:hypothetical protein